MTTTRILPGVVLVAIVTAGPAAGQYVMPPYSPPGGAAAGQYATMPPYPSPWRTAAESPAGQPPAASSLERLTAPLPPGATSDPVGALTSPQGPPGAPGLPPGAYASPWFTDGPGCCGPMGRHGQVAYELYLRTGPDFLIGGGRFLDRLDVGWGLAGGGRSLFLNPAGDAAWVVDLGLGYTYNRGSSTALTNLFIRQPALTTTNAAGVTISVPRPDLLINSRIRALHRTAFNYALGREWFLWGSGAPGAEPGWNLRVGADLGGQWGTAHVDVVPNNDPRLYARRQKVFEGIFLAGHANVEVPIGGVIWFGGIRSQIGYEWLNIVPPLKGDVSYIDVLLTTGIRF
ncbi:MAG: hypothetical protein JWO38_224 [Gemmataceae bacterium]|nr:hypothetical protein [Gemmataceae bacterium]